MGVLCDTQIRELIGIEPHGLRAQLERSFVSAGQFVIAQ
jgi:hypothetical protein